MARQQHLNRIATLREARNLRVRDLARLTGANDSQISKLERSLMPLNQDWQYRISKALNCQPWELLPEWGNLDVMTFVEANWHSLTDEQRAALHRATKPGAPAPVVEHGPGTGMSATANLVFRPSTADEQGRYPQVEIRDDGSRVVTIVYFRPRPDDPPARKKQNPVKTGG